MAYELEGTLYEVCDCDVICPCWVGHDPDGGDCRGTMLWFVEDGAVDGLDVSGLGVGMAAYVPGNILEGGWKVVLFVDDRCTEEQSDALLSVFTGERGGPVADLAAGIGEVADIERARIRCETHQGSGSLEVGDSARARWEGIEGGTGEPAALRDTAFSTIPGAPAYVSRTTEYELHRADLGLDVSVEGRSAVQTAFRYHG